MAGIYVRPEEAKLLLDALFLVPQALKTPAWYQACHVALKIKESSSGKGAKLRLVPPPQGAA